MSGYSGRKMHKETAEVIKVDEAKALLKVEKKAMCDCCRIAAACDKNQGVFEIPNNNLGLEKGEKIEIGIETKKAVAATFIIFIIPLFLFLFSLILLREKGELFSFSLALLAMVIYYIVVKAFLRKTKKFSVKVLKKI